MGDRGEERGRAEERTADDVARDRREGGRAECVEREFAQDDLESEEQAGDRRVEGRGDASGRTARHDDPHAAFAHPHELAERRGERRADLHDRAFASDRAAGSDADRRRERLDHRDRRPDAPAVLGHGEHHLGNAMAASLARAALDERAVDEAPDHGRHEHEPEAKPRQVRARRVPLLPELVVPRRDPGQREDERAEARRAQPREAADRERHDHEAQARAPEPGLDGAQRRHRDGRRRVGGEEGGRLRLGGWLGAHASAHRPPPGP